MTYLKEAFDAATLKQAKDTALSPDPTRPDKFKEETDYLVGVIEVQGIASPEALMLDFGCGMGRVAKKLIDTFGCRVVGTDTSKAMLGFAREYVASEQFEAYASYEGRETIDLAIAAFVLQHAEHPTKEIAAIHAVLKPTGYLVLLDDGKRFVPSGVDAQGFVVWQDDGIVVEKLIEEKFLLVSRFPYPNRHDLPLSIWKKI